MGLCRLCRQPTPCACKPYNAIREQGEPGEAGDPAVLPTFTCTVIEGAVAVLLGGTLVDPTLQFSQPAPDVSLSYTWLGTNTFTGGVEFGGTLTVLVGEGTGPGFYLPGSTVTTTLTVTGSSVILGGHSLFDNAVLSLTEITNEGFTYLSGPTHFASLTINGPLSISGVTLPPITTPLSGIGPTLITGSTQLGFEAFVDSCNLTKESNAGIILQQLRLEPSWPFSTVPVAGDGLEHVLFASTIVVGSPECGGAQSALADLIATIDVLAQVGSIGDRWTIRMRQDDPSVGVILDSYQFYTLVTGGFADWPDMRVLLRNIAVPVATGETTIYFTAQSDDSGVDDLLLFTDAPTQPKLTVQ